MDWQSTEPWRLHYLYNQIQFIFWHSYFIGSVEKNTSNFLKNLLLFWSLLFGVAYRSYWEMDNNFERCLYISVVCGGGSVREGTENVQSWNFMDCLVLRGVIYNLFGLFSLLVDLLFMSDSTEWKLNIWNCILLSILKVLYNNLPRQFQCFA